MKYLESNWVKLLLVGVALIVVYKSVDNIDGVFALLGSFVSIIMPVIIGGAIALFAYPPVCRIRAFLTKTNRKFIADHALSLGVFIVYVLFFVVVALAVKFIFPILYKNVEELVLKLPGYVDNLNGLLNQLGIAPKLDITYIGERLLNYFNLDRINQYFSVITGIANSFLSIVVSLIVSVYMILEKENIIGFIKKMRHRFHFAHKTDVLVQYTKKIIRLFYSYFAGLVLDSILIGTISTVVFAVFRVPYAVFLGLTIAIGNMIPFFGPIVAAGIAYFIAMISLGPVNALWILIFQLVLGQIDGNVIQPKIVGSKVGVSPLLVLISVMIFGGIFGPVGMILGVPICAAAKLVLEDYLEDGKFDASADEM